jgi:tetratricopeptide (TPR) repeat protein
MVAQPPFPPREQRLPLAFVLADYPFPVAVAYARLQTELDRQEPVAAAWQLLDVFQCALKFCACVAVADHLRAEPRGPVTAGLVARLFKPLSLGDWQTLLEDALRPLKEPARRGALGQSGCRVPELYGVFFRPANGQRTEVARKLFASEPNLVKWRNQVFGHGVFRHDRAFYADEVNRWRPLLDELLTALRPVLSAWALAGRTPGGERLDWTGAGEVSPAAPHAHQPWGDPLPLHLACRAVPEVGLDLGPLLTVQQCTVCRQPAAFFFEGDRYDREKDTHRTHFVEYFAGHGVDRKDWLEVRNLAGRLPADFEWERASYDWRAAAEEVSRLFRNFEDEYRRPDYLLDAFWDFVDGRPKGFVHLVGPAGVGKSYLVQGVQEDARDRGTAVLVYHILAGQLADYRAFVSELADRAREQLRCRTQEIQTRVGRLADLAEQTAEFLAELMRANGLERLVVAIDALDELREPDSAGSPLISDFLPPPERLPEGCFFLLTSRTELRPRVRERLDQLRAQDPVAFCALSLEPDGEANRDLLRAYLREQLPEPFRTPDAVEAVLQRSAGVFLYAFHLSRALGSGVFADTAGLPEGEQFYPAYLARLRAQVGEQDYQELYLRTLLLLAAARQPVLPEQLRRWGVRGERLPLVLQDLADFLRVVKGRRWHESLNDDGDNRYELAHDAFLRFVRADAQLAEQLRQAHATIAQAILARHQGHWEALDPRDDADLYDLRFAGSHLSGAEPRAQGSLEMPARDYIDACFRIGNQAHDRQRFTIARDAFEQAVALARRQVLAGHADWDEDLASSLVNLGSALGDQGEPAVAIDAFTEAIAICRRRVQAGRPELDGTLASALNNRGWRLRARGELSAALDAFREALAIRRRHAQAGHDDGEKALAGVLSNLGNALGDQGDHAAAIDAFREAIAIDRRLVQAGRADLEDDLARDLNNLGIALDEQGEPLAAIDPLREAIAIHRRLVQAGRAELENDLASDLNNLANALRNQGDLSAALDTCRESVAIRRRQVQAGRAELESELAGALGSLGLALRAQGEMSDALEAFHEAIALFRRLVQAGRADLTHSLTRALIHLGDVLHSQEELSEAIDAYREAVAIRRRLVQAGRGDLDNDLSRALNNLGNALHAWGELGEAIDACREAAVLLRRLVRDGRADLDNDLAMALSNLGNKLRDRGEVADALDACAEAVAIRRRLVQAGRADLHDDLAMALMNLGLTCEEGGDVPQAAALYHEGIRTWERCVERGQVHLLPSLLKASGTRFSLQRRQEDWDAAADTVRTALGRTDSLFPDGDLPPAVLRAFNAFLGRIANLDDDERQSLFAALGADAAIVRRMLGEG